MAVPLVAVTDHAVERYRQRVRGVMDAKPEIAGRVAAAWAEGSCVPAERGTVHVRDLRRPDLVYVCVHDRPRGELIVVTLWEEGDDAAVPRRFTDAIPEPRRREPKASQPPAATRRR